uniref:WASH complex subunit 3 n=1 Tax=Glossina palpalis gambiensis TaxID=67801 RepID=A0A1B0BWB7_9MUSC
MDASEILIQNVDKTQLPPLHQKRILAFVNNFLISSCSFLNEFVVKCETKFIELERKLQKVEAALIILEAKLASIPDEEVKGSEIPATEKLENELESSSKEMPFEKEEEEKEQGVKACDHELFKKYFKMVQVGVPTQAVKIKMQAEGLDPNILDNPNTSITSNTDIIS